MFRPKKHSENSIIFSEGGKFLKVIYIDILLVLNLIVDYLVLFGTARLSGERFVRLRGISSALIGAVYSMVILLDMPKMFFVISKLAVSIFMVAVTFGKRNIKDFFRLLIIFYICGFIFSGFMMLINSVVHADTFFIKGGVVYFEFSAAGIVLSGTAAFLVTEIFRRFFKRGSNEKNFVARICFENKTAVLKGFMDTGNELSDPLTGTPAAVASPGSFSKILPQKMLSAIENKSLSTEYRIRLIPCKTVSGSMLIPAIRPEKLIIENEKGVFETEDILIAFSENVPENMLIIGDNIIYKEKGKFFSEV